MLSWVSLSCHHGWISGGSIKVRQQINHQSIRWPAPSDDWINSRRKTKQNMVAIQPLWPRWPSTSTVDRRFPFIFKRWWVFFHYPTHKILEVLSTAGGTTPVEKYRRTKEDGIFQICSSMVWFASADAQKPLGTNAVPLQYMRSTMPPGKHIRAGNIKGGRGSQYGKKRNENVALQFLALTWDYGACLAYALVASYCSSRPSSLCYCSSRHDTHTIESFRNAYFIVGVAFC